MDQRKYEHPEIEDWEDRSEAEIQSLLGLGLLLGLGAGFGFACAPRRSEPSRQFCWPRQGCWPR